MLIQHHCLLLFDFQAVYLHYPWFPVIGNVTTCHPVLCHVINQCYPIYTRCLITHINDYDQKSYEAPCVMLQNLLKSDYDLVKLSHHLNFSLSLSPCAWYMDLISALSSGFGGFLYLLDSPSTCIPSSASQDSTQYASKVIKNLNNL